MRRMEATAGLALGLLGAIIALSIGVGVLGALRQTDDLVPGAGSAAPSLAADRAARQAGPTAAAPPGAVATTVATSAPTVPTSAPPATSPRRVAPLPSATTPTPPTTPARTTPVRTTPARTTPARVRTAPAPAAPVPVGRAPTARARAGRGPVARATEIPPAASPTCRPPPPAVRPSRVLWLAVFVAIVLLPVALLAVAGATRASAALRVGAGLGFAVFVLCGLQFVLPARSLLSRPIGLDVLLRLHRHVGLVALALVVGHVVVVMVDDPSRLRLFDVVHAPVRAKAGVLATTALAVLTVTSLWRTRTRLRYERWRFLHGVLGLAIVLLAFVHIVGVGRFSRSAPLLAVSLSVLGVAGGAFAYLRAGRPFTASFRPYRVRSVRPEAGGATTLEVEAVGRGDTPFRPGQFAWIKMSSSPFGLTEHPFSYASSAAEPSTVSFTIKGIGDFTSRIGALPPGTTVLLDGPHGSYEPAHPDAGFVLVTAGIGITPIMSLLRTAADVGDRRPYTLVYGSRRYETITFREELERLEARLDLTVVHALTQPPPAWRGEVGRIRAEVLERVLTPLDRPLNAFVCGPPGMVDSTVAALTRLGLTEAEIHAERFTSA